MKINYVAQNDKFIISTSFANYLKDKSGVSKVIMAHQQVYNNAKISYVYLFSVKKNICNDKIMLFCKFGLIIDGEYIGVFQMSQLLKLFSEWQISGKSLLLDIHIHHLLFTNLNLIKELLDSCNKTTIKVYLHDYYYACKEYSLLKNGKVFCGGNGLNSINCEGCQYYKDSVNLEKHIHNLFERYLNRLIFVSPSETTKKIFKRFHPEYVKQIIVIPHQKYNTRYLGNLEPVLCDDKIRVAFLGMPQVHKGWPTWERLVKDNMGDNYSFVLFNSNDDSYLGMKKVKIGFTKDNLNAMTDALREKEIHIVILWSITPETYSFTCFEAFSANVFIITNKDSGNIASVVNENQNGIVLSNENELYSLFKDVDIVRDMINKYRGNTPGGPGILQENDEIVAWTLKNSQKGEINYKHKIVNYPLLWLLNKIINK